MPTDQVGSLLRTARRRLGLSQMELARRAGVSTRLCAEVERGVRPNVSLATALRPLAEVGVSVQLTGPFDATTELTGSSAATRQARAAARRATWSGRPLRLGAAQRSGSVEQRRSSGEIGELAGPAALAAVARVSGQAFAVAPGRRLADTAADSSAGGGGRPTAAGR